MLCKLWKRIKNLMDIADRVEKVNAAVGELAAQVTALDAKVSAITAPTVDFTAVLAAIADVKAQLFPTDTQVV